MHLIGRATKTKIELDQDYIDERLPVAGREMIYRRRKQLHSAECRHEYPDAGVGAGRHQRGDGRFTELYCGNGNFAGPARNFDRVLATEIAKPSVAAAQYNIAANHIDNVQIIRMSAEEFTQAMNGVREFNRLQSIDLKSYQCETILSIRRAAGWIVKPRRWCRRTRVFCTSPVIRRPCARIWKP